MQKLMKFNEFTDNVPSKLLCSEDDPILRLGKTTKSLLLLFFLHNLFIILSRIILSVPKGK